MRQLIFLIVFLLLPLTAGADTYWVDDNGSASWGNCNSASPLSGASACSVGTANSNATAGDTVYLRAGTYSTGLAPTTSGTSNNRIVFSGYESETVTFDGMNAGINLGGYSYITATKFVINNTTLGLWLNGGDYNTISYSIFQNHTGNNWDANLVYNGAEYNHIHNNTFGTNGGCIGGSDDGAVFRIGQEAGSDNSRYNLVEDNIFYHGGHHVFGLHGNRNIVRNNYMYNDAWTNGTGNRTLYLLGTSGVTGYNVIENNRFGYAAVPCDDVRVGNVAISTQYNIFRYNYLYHHNAYGLGFGYYSGYDTGANNRIYNNTFHDSDNIDSAGRGGSEDAAVSFQSSQTVGNILKNNLYNIQNKKYGGRTGSQTYANEYDDSVDGDPLFANATATPPADVTDSSLPDFTISASSPAVNAGGALTTVNSSDTGSGTSLIVDDARYFQDGTWARPGLVDADWIAVGRTSNVVRIISINYSTNTIALASSISRIDGDDVWLYMDSDGTVVLYGTQSDAGANEYGQENGNGRDVIPPSAPGNFQITN